ncbi:hypothetical protein, partial [Streptomyces mutabilis]|uniref:hypothetical protein n=1 Tax=Streptomyces mutabilis TaxID=67332 RepID=UPI001E5DC5C5
MGAQLEMALVAARLSTGADQWPYELRDVVVEGPIPLTEGGRRVHVSLFPGADDIVEWSVETEDEEPVLGSSGLARWVAEAAADPLDVEAARDLGTLVELDDSAAEGLTLVPAQVDAGLEALCRQLGADTDAVSAIGTVRVHGVGAASWAVVDGGAGAVLLYLQDGTPLVELLDVTVSSETETDTETEAEPETEAAEVVREVSGPGRRAEMAGWSVEQCLAWEL